MMGWQNLLLCNIPRDGGGGGNDNSSGGDNQGSQVGEPSNDTQDTVGDNDPSPPDATPPDQDPDAPSPNANLAGGIIGGLQGLTPEMAIGFADKAGFGTNIAGFTSDITLGSNTTTPFGGLNTDPSSTPGYAGSPNSGQLGALGSSFDSRSDLDASVPETSVSPPEPTVNPPESTVNPPESTVQVAETEAETQALENALGMTSGPAPEGPSLGDPSGPGSGGGGGGPDPIVTTPTTTADVLNTDTVTPITTVTPTTTTTTVSPVKYDVSKFLGNLGKTTYTPAPSVYRSYPISVTPKYGATVAQQGIGQFYKPYFPLIPYQRRYP